MKQYTHKFDLPRLARAIVLALRDFNKRKPGTLSADVRKRLSGKKAHEHYLERLSGDRHYYTAVKTNQAIMSKYWQIG